MNLMKPTTVTVALLTAGLLSAGTTLPGPRAMGDSSSMPKVVTQHAGADNSLTWVEKRVWEWQPSPEERSLDSIGWARDIRTAQRLAKEHARPVFLFTHDGRMGIGRC